MSIAKALRYINAYATAYQISLSELQKFKKQNTRMKGQGQKKPIQMRTEMVRYYNNYTQNIIIKPLVVPAKNDLFAKPQQFVDANDAGKAHIRTAIIVSGIKPITQKRCKNGHKELTKLNDFCNNDHGNL